MNAAVGFSQSFSAADKKIMDSLGDDIVFTAPNGGVFSVKCVLIARPGTGNKPGFEVNDNVWAKIDIYSTVIELLESAVPGIAKTWSATYQNTVYAISELMPIGDGTIIAVLTRPGNSVETTSGWR